MSKKPSSIMAAAAAASKKPQQNSDTQPNTTKKATSKKSPQKSTSQVKNKTQSREGRKSTTFWVMEEALKQLKVMAVTDDTSMQALVDEAINDLFIKYNKPPIAAERDK